MTGWNGHENINGKKIPLKIQKEVLQDRLFSHSLLFFSTSIKNSHGCSDLSYHKKKKISIYKESWSFAWYFWSLPFLIFLMLWGKKKKEKISVLYNKELRKRHFVLVKNYGFLQGNKSYITEKLPALGSRFNAMSGSLLPGVILNLFKMGNVARHDPIHLFHSLLCNLEMFRHCGGFFLTSRGKEKLRFIHLIQDLFIMTWTFLKTLH